MNKLLCLHVNLCSLSHNKENRFLEMYVNSIYMKGVYTPLCPQYCMFYALMSYHKTCGIHSQMEKNTQDKSKSDCYKGFEIFKMYSSVNNVFKMCSKDVLAACAV